MQIDNNSVVTFHYTLHDAEGVELDASRTRDMPLTVLIGHENIVAGLDRAMHGHTTGDRFDVVVEPVDGYGMRREDFVQRVAKKYFREPDRLRPGSTATLSVQEGGQRSVTVLKVGSSVIDVDLNHPLAGKTLKFDVEITDVRAATAEEIAHRHVHGPHGHAH